MNEEQQKYIDAPKEHQKHIEAEKDEWLKGAFGRPNNFKGSPYCSECALSRRTTKMHTGRVEECDILPGDDARNPSY